MASLPSLRLGPTGWPQLDPGIQRQTEAQLVFRSALLQVGRFRARPGDPHFHYSGPPGQHVFVFPRSSVRIRHAGAEPFVTDRELVTFYNPNQLYFREAVSPIGDDCDWFALRPDVVAAIAVDVDPGVEPDSPELFRYTRGPCDAASYLLQRALLAAIAERGAPEAGFIEEAAVELLARLLSAASCREAVPGGAAWRQQRDLAEAARARVALRFHHDESLDDLARDLGCSVGHLCRVFRRCTGRTLHAHRDELRLRSALDQLRDPERRLSQLAVELGYSSHSHFTAAFRRRFGVTPAWLRRRGTPRDIRRLLRSAPSGAAA